MGEMENNLELTAEEQQDESGFALLYGVELLYKNKPVVSREILYAKMQQYTGAVQGSEAWAGKSGEAEEGSRPDMLVWEANQVDTAGQLTELFFHMNHTTEMEGKAVPAQTGLFSLKDELELQQYETAVQQAWHWPQARETVADCRYSLLLTDLFAAGLDYQERLGLFQQALRALLETAPCDAVYWKASDKLVHPQQYLEAVAGGELLYGAVNVRFFKVEGTGSGRQEMLMDTCGLAALGVPDVQCHFYDMEPNMMASQLMDLAYYLYHQGDIIADGETIGATEEQRWRCEHQYALAGPRRFVLDIDPGEPYYAGRQNGS